MLCGFPPFYSDDVEDLFDQIRNADYSFPSQYWSHVSTPCRDFVEKLLVTDPEERMTPDQALGHPWIRDITAQLLSHFASQRSSRSPRAPEGLPDAGGEAPADLDGAAALQETCESGGAQLQRFIFGIVAINRIRGYLYDTFVGEATMSGDDDDAYGDQYGGYGEGGYGTSADY